MSIKQTKYLAFTSKANGKANQLLTDCRISLPFNPKMDKGKKAPKEFDTKALWDTGATQSVITEKTAREANLVPISKRKVHHAGGTSFQNLYLINIYLPNRVAISNIHVTECKDTGAGFGMLIGMDIIGLGDFSISNFNNETTFTFRIPSMEITDYVKEQKIAQAKTQSPKPTSTNKINRNDPCHCGSGKKYKYCHGKK